MAKTFYLDDGAAFATINDGSGEVLGTLDMTDSPGGSATVNFVIPNSVSRRRFWVENVTDVTRVSTGTCTVHVNITASGDTASTMFVALLRVNSSGVIQATGAETASQACTTGTKTFSPAITGLGTWNAGDRLAVKIRIQNANAHGGDDTYTISVGVADATDDVVASDFTGPPDISSASMGDSGRDWTTPYQEVTIVFDRAMEKSGGVAYGVGDTIPGLTIGPSGSEGAVTYRSGDSTATWVVRRAALAKNGDSWVIDYARSTGELVQDGGGTELLDKTNFAITNNLTKRVRETLKDDAGSAITTACSIALLDAEPRTDSDGAWLAVLQRHPNITPTAGLIDLEVTDASLVVGDPVYLATFNPRENAGGPSTYARTSLSVVTVT